MLKYARENAPDVEFIHADARSFILAKVYHAVISAFDSLNHIMKYEDLLTVFQNVNSVLLDDGVFLFDLNLEEESELLGNSLSLVDDDHACIVRSGYDPREKLKRYDLTMFRKEDESWHRSDMTLFQRYYDNDEVLSALAEAGFTRVKSYDARREFGFTLSDGRLFYLARK